MTKQDDKLPVNYYAALDKRLTDLEMMLDRLETRVAIIESDKAGAPTLMVASQPTTGEEGNE